MSIVVEKKHYVISHESAPRCSDYDDECMDVPNPVSCWCGGDGITSNGILVTLPPSDGYCPLMFNKP
jgi:hypothetical protein